MAQNVEIKARANNFSQQQRIAEQISDQDLVTLVQEDTFFKVPEGRLKLREFPDRPGQLIYYRRPDSEGPKLSEYYISETEDAKGLKNVLSKAYGIEQVVKKVRSLLMSGRTRLHFDVVENLGEFIELEVVMGENDSIEDGQNEAKALMQTLKIREQDLIDTAYADLLAKN